MASFQERIKSTLRRVESAKAGPVAGFDRVLTEFVDTLRAEESYLGASIEKAAHQPQLRSFVTWPRYRRDERTIMLSFWWDGTTMRVLNEQKRDPFDSPDALSEYLLDFLEKSAFRWTLTEYEARCKEPVDGYLRTTSLVDAGPNDVMVVVSSAQQKELVEAKPGTTLNLVVLPDPVAGTAEYRERAGYGFLYSGGFGLRLAAHGLADGKVHLVGDVMPSGVEK